MLAKAIASLGRQWGGVGFMSGFGGLDASAAEGATTAPGDTTTAMTASLAMPVSDRGQPGTASLSPDFSCVKEGNSTLRMRNNRHAEYRKDVLRNLARSAGNLSVIETEEARQFR
ncbi:hypothetical protein ACIQ9K_35915 [Streptomyces microflavus]|uniref:hypothetical protein n=1 Tax=Streptomyces microflavus TaxID=1919 RepID=UPI0038173A7D